MQNGNAFYLNPFYCHMMMHVSLVTFRPLGIKVFKSYLGEISFVSYRLGPCYVFVHFHIF